ncbi:hypothetical protein GCM10022223_00110 [Kineosporia mesophila]|uniref:Uncharacterized protein n=1 Tax=Kineosporia mesophila TaxID=566012 RepID=A0ABP6YRR2_9ACTN
MAGARAITVLVAAMRPLYAIRGTPSERGTHIPGETPKIHSVIMQNLPSVLELWRGEF